MPCIYHVIIYLFVTVVIINFFGMHLETVLHAEQKLQKESSVSFLEYACTNYFTCFLVFLRSLNFSILFVRVILEKWRDIQHINPS